MIGAQLVATAKWSTAIDATGLEDGFASINRMRGVLAAWDQPIDGRPVISVLVFEPNDKTRLEIIEGVVRHLISDVRRESTAEVPTAAAMSSDPVQIP